MSQLISLRNDLFAAQDVVVIDTETTGLEGDDEVVQLSAVDFNGLTIFNEYIKPRKPISEGASSVHGITNEKVADCHGIRYYWDFFCKKALYQKVVVGYNVMYDIRILLQSAVAADPSLSNTRLFSPLMVVDVMQLAVMGKGLSKFPRLANLADMLGVEVAASEGFHDSLFDCVITAACLRKLVLL